MCADCFFGMLCEAKVLPSLPQQAPRDGGFKMCWVCQYDDTVHPDRKTVICFDCVVDGLIAKHIVHKTVRHTFRLATVDRVTHDVPKCQKCVCPLKPNRRHRLCIDCMIDAVIKANIIRVEDDGVFEY